MGIVNDRIWNRQKIESQNELSKNNKTNDVLINQTVIKYRGKLEITIQLVKRGRITW